MRSGLLIPLLLGSLGGCTLYIDEEGGPADPGESPDPLPDPVPEPPPELPTPAQRFKALIAEWSGCMSLENFTNAGMATTWSQILSDSGKCTLCHAEASPTYPVSSNAGAFFQRISEHSMSMFLFFTVDLASYPGKVIIDLRPFQSVGSGAPPYAAHPRFIVGPPPLTAIARFYDMTTARKAAGGCDPPRLID